MHATSPHVASVVQLCNTHGYTLGFYSRSYFSGRRSLVPEKCHRFLIWWLLCTPPSKPTQWKGHLMALNFRDICTGYFTGYQRQAIGRWNRQCSIVRRSRQNCGGENRLKSDEEETTENGIIYALRGKHDFRLFSEMIFVNPPLCAINATV